MTNTYHEPVSKLLMLGRPDPAGPWLEYQTLGLTGQDIPDLIQLLQDDELRHMVPPDDRELSEWYAQIHAWRALAQLHATEAIPALLNILFQIDYDDDDWLSSDAPDVFALLGEPAVAPLADYLADEDSPMYARAATATSLARVAATHPETRERSIRAIAAVLEQYEENDEGLNGFLIGDLIDLQAVEQIDLIRQAFEAEAVDEMINGDFEDVQIQLGLLKERQTPAPSWDFLRGMEAGEVGDSWGSPSQKSGSAQKKEKNKRKQEKKSRKKNRKKK